MNKQIETYKLVPHPNNPRANLGDLTELKDSILVSGILQNLTVVESATPDVYIVVIGHRRLAAAMLAGLETVPCVVAEMDEQKQQATMLLENMQRSALTPSEEAQGFQMCLNLGMSENELASKTGLSKSTVKRRLKILELDKDKVKSAQGTLGDYIALESVTDIDTRNDLLKHMGTNNFDLMVAKAVAAQEKPTTELKGEVSREIAVEKDENEKVFRTLRINFMKEIFKTKIAKEAFADSVFALTETLIAAQFKVSTGNKVFQEIVNPNKLNVDQLSERASKNRVNFFVVAIFSIREESKNVKEIYDFLSNFGYKSSDAELEWIQNA